VRFWQALTWAETEQLPELAEIAEELGFDGVLVSDHAFVPREPTSRYPYSPDGMPSFTGASEYPDVWVLLGALAARTRRLALATSVFVLPQRHPVLVAKAAASLAVLSAGRFALGVGVGWDEAHYEALGVDFASRGRRADECIEVLRKLWQAGWVEHRGEFFSFPAIRQRPAPREGVPIWVGGHSPAALRRAARLGDGFIGSGHTPDEAVRVLGELAALRRDCGREHTPFETLIGLSTAPDLDTFRRLEERGMTSGVSYPFRHALGERSGLDAKRRLMEGFAKRILVPMRARRGISERPPGSGTAR
jgi:probable F420-dependent oxidoreductase